LREAGTRTAAIGTLGVQALGAPKEFHATRPTTPEAPDLQRLLSDLRADGVDRVVMEVTSHALDLGRVDGCRFRAAVFTNITQDHMDFHSSLDEYREAKGRLFAMVDADGACVINADDASSSAMIARSRARVWTYGVEQPATVRGEDVEISLRGARFTAVWPGGRLPLALRLDPFGDEVAGRASHNGSAGPHRRVGCRP
jgi:UDP-N-acetylmuramoyl-L-alanyl-D-glutamate--2,6-diaminopimelate ligase